MNDFLFECLSAEMPVASQHYAVGKISSKIDDYMNKWNMVCAESRVFVTPRRLAIIIRGLGFDADKSLQKSIIKGPRTDASQKAIEGFLHKHGKSRTDLKVVRNEQKDFFCLEQKSDYTNIAETLRVMVLDILESMDWPKSMRWSNKSTKWIRPIVNLLCLYNGAVLQLSFAGIETNDMTTGHRYMYGNVFFEVYSTKDYMEKLKSSHVFLDHISRKLYIKGIILGLLDSNGMKVELDEDLLDRVTASVEWPMALMGGIDPKFMVLPEHLLRSIMKNQQDYFPVLTQSGEIAAHFISISNVANCAVVEGNEMVLSARLEDARFMIDQDMKNNLDYYAERLGKIVFHHKLGSMKDKIDRVSFLVEYLVSFIHSVSKSKVMRLVYLAKADLATSVVANYPSLQGVMGRYYASSLNEDPEITEAIEEHYYPLTSSSKCTHNLLAVTLIIADRVDTVVGLIGVGERLTSNRDLMGIKRTIFGIIHTLIVNKIRVNIMNIVDKSISIYLHDQNTHVFSSCDVRFRLCSKLQILFYERLKTVIKEHNLPVAVMKAVIYEDDIFRYYHDVNLLNSFISTKLGEAMLQSYRRVMNLLTKEEKKFGQVFTINHKAKLLLEKIEVDLSDRIASVEDDIDIFLKARDLAKMLEAIVNLQVFINAFIDGVVINCDSHDIRENRLMLLSKVRSLFAKIANFQFLL